nr:tetratricopeptide repeat protein [Verrucomicrobiota bacterium]
MTDEPHETQIAIRDFDLSQLPADQRALEGDVLRQAIREHFEEKFIRGAGASEIAITQDTIILRWASETPLQPLVDRAVDLLTRGEFDRGISLLEAALLVNADDEVALFNLGMALSDKGKLDDAIRHLRRLVKLDPEHPNAWVALGVAHARS